MNFLDSRRADFVNEALEMAGLPASEDAVVPQDKRLVVREILIQLLEASRICSRDAVRIADAWCKGSPAPEDWRYI